MGPSVVVLLFRDLPRFSPRPVSRSILNPFACHWALWATEGEQQQLQEGKKENAKKFFLSKSCGAPVQPCNCSTLPLCNPATVQSDLKEREGVGILLRGAIQWGANFVRIPLGLWWRLFILYSIGSKGFVVDRDAFVKNLIKVLHLSSHKSTKVHFTSLGTCASRTECFHSKWLIFIVIVSRSSKTFLSLSLFYCLCLWSDQ